LSEPGRRRKRMFFRQVLHPDLGCASYVLADSGEAAVVDPKWAIRDYLELAEEQGFEIAHIVETHNHADHLSGCGRLAQATGARIHAPAGADVEYEHEPLVDGAAIELGKLKIVAFATPGHRPEHTAYLVADHDRTEEIWCVLTGDSLFVGDVARPDLAIDPEDGARLLFRSLRELMMLEDYVELWPGHVGGSLCGSAAMSKKPSSTIGVERLFNPLIRLDENEFVRKLTGDMRPQPPNFERIVDLNRGPPLTESVPLEPLTPAGIDELLSAGALLLDGRTPREYDAAHVSGSINVTMAEDALGTRAAWIADLETRIVVLGPGELEARRMGELLEAVGFRDLRGFLAGGMGAWHDADLPIETTPAIDPATLAEHIRANRSIVIDVREDDEWDAGHVAHSIHVPYRELREQITDDIREAGKPLAVACSAGNRSSIAAGLLRRAGIENVEHVVDGGVPDLEQEGVELEKG
jgi:hydroxyacylglutathione hydrolase